MPARLLKRQKQENNTTYRTRKGIYINICLFWCKNMKRIIGYTLFWIAMGMILMMVLPNNFLGIVIIGAALLVSYYLFSC